MTTFTILLFMEGCGGAPAAGGSGGQESGQVQSGAEGTSNGGSEDDSTAKADASGIPNDEGAQGAAKENEAGDAGFILEDTSTVTVDIADEEVE